MRVVIEITEIIIAVPRLKACLHGFLFIARLVHFGDESAKHRHIVFLGFGIHFGQNVAALISESGFVGAGVRLHRAFAAQNGRDVQLFRFRRVFGFVRRLNGVLSFVNDGLQSVPVAKVRIDRDFFACRFAKTAEIAFFKSERIAQFGQFRQRVAPFVGLHDQIDQARKFGGFFLLLAFIRSGESRGQNVFRLLRFFAASVCFNGFIHKLGNGFGHRLISKKNRTFHHNNRLSDFCKRFV